MPAIPALLIIFGVLWLLVRHPKRFVLVWLTMFVVAVLFVSGVLLTAFYLRR